MQTHPSKRASQAIWLGVLTIAVLLPLGDTLAGFAGPTQGEGDTPQGVPAKKTFKSVDKTIAVPSVAVAPPIVDESGVAFGLRSSSLDERRSLVTGVAFSADGKVLATSGRALKLWDVAGAKLLVSTREPVTMHVAISADGKALATVDDKGAVFLRDPATAAVRFALGRPGNGGRGIVFAPGGKLLLCVGRDGKLHWWDAPSGKPTKGPIAEADSVQALAFSRDGKTLVTGTTTNAVHVWDLTKGKPHATITRKSFSVVVALSPDGTTVATLGSQSIELWNAADGKAIAELKKDNTIPRFYSYGSAQDVVFAPDGKLLAVAHGNGGVALWDVKTRKEIAEIGFETNAPPSPSYAMPAQAYGSSAPVGFAPQAVPALAFSPDGKRLAVNKGTHAVLFDIANRVQVARFPPQGLGPQPVLALAYSPDGKTVAAALEDRTISVREVDTGEELLRLRGHGERVTCVAFAADGKTLVSGSADKTVKVWDAASGKERRTFRGHREWVYAVALAPDGKTVASGGYDRGIKLWNAATGEEIETFAGHKGAVRALAFNQNGKTLASGSADHTIRLWDVRGPLGATTLTGHKATVRALAFSRDGQILVSTSDDGTARSWDVTKGKERLIYKDHGNASVVAVAFTPAGDRVATASANQMVYVWDPLTGKGRGQPLNAHHDALTAVAFAPDGQTLTTGSYDKSVRFWPGVAVPIRVFQGHKATIASAVLSADGSRVLSAGGTLMSRVDPKQRKLLAQADLLGLGNGDRWDNTVRLWDAGTGKTLRVLRGHTDRVLTVAFSPNGRQALSAGHDKTIRRWDLASGKTLNVLTGHEKAIRAVAYSPKGRFAVSGSDDRTVRLWDLETGKQVRALKQHMKEVRTVAFSPDGKRIVSGDRDGLVLIWDVAGGATRPLRRGGDGVESVVWTSDGRRIVCAAGQWVEVYDAKTNKRLQQVGGHGGRIEQVALLPGDRVAGGLGQDGRARFWDLAKGVELAQLELTPPSPPAPTSVRPPSGYPVPPAAAAEDAPAEKVEVKEAQAPPAAQPLPPQGQLPPMYKDIPLERSLSLSVSADGRHLLTVSGVNMATPGVSNTMNLGSAPVTGPSINQTIRLWKTPALDRPAPAP